MLARRGGPSPPVEAARLPRLLIIGLDEPAPRLSDDLEDWLRDPPDPADLVARLATLSRRARAVRQLSHLGRDGLLWSGRRWVVIPDPQLCIVELLLAHANELVTTTTITTTYAGTGRAATVLRCGRCSTDWPGASPRWGWSSTWCEARA